MFRVLKDRKKKDNKGFTLVELIIVIAILAILVGLLAPQYVKYVEKSRKSADVSNLDNLVEGLKVAAADTEYNLSTTSDTKIEYTIVISNLGTELKDSKGIATATDQAAKALEAYSGLNFTGGAVISGTTLKSMKWGTDNTAIMQGATSEIWAKVTIDKNDAVTVEYSTNVSSYAKNGTV